jgi:parallel beta-helix repeat protein
LKNKVGIFLNKCNGNDIIANIINENIHKGILLQYSVDNKISKNTLNSNGLGIVMEDFSSNNTVHYNSLSKNRGNIRANYSINQIKNNYMNNNSSQNLNSDSQEIPFINSTFLLILIATAFVFSKNKRGNKRK